MENLIPGEHQADKQMKRRPCERAGGGLPLQEVSAGHAGEVCIGNLPGRSPMRAGREREGEIRRDSLYSVLTLSPLARTGRGQPQGCFQ